MIFLQKIKTICLKLSKQSKTYFKNIQSQIMNKIVTIKKNENQNTDLRTIHKHKHK